ncbi:MAG TPA: FtsW/RodA/SpoVE family cell cycle protein, partial [Pseudoduganella sp.]
MNRRLLLVPLAILFGLQLLGLLRAPAPWRPAAIVISLERAGTVTLDAAQLGAVQAGGLRLTVSRSGEGIWRLRAAGPVRPLLGRGGTDERLGSVDPAALRSFRIGGGAFDVKPDADGMLAFTDGVAHWRFDGATLYRDGKAQPPCPGSALATQAVALWNRIVPQPFAAARPAIFGGSLHCGNRIGLAGVAGGGAQIAQRVGSGTGSGLVLSGGPATVLADGASLRDDERRLDGVRTLALGRTRYGVTLDHGSLTLAPAGRVALHMVPETTLPPQVAWQWQRRSLWQGSAGTWLPAAAAALALLASACLGQHTPRRRGNILGPLANARRQRPAWVAAGRRLRGLSAALLLAAGCAALLLQRGGDPPATACSLLLAACAVAAWLPQSGRVPVATAAALLLIGAGLLCQLNLGLAGMDTGWLRFYGKTAALLATGSGAVGLWRLFPPDASQRRIEWLLAGAAGCALLLLAAQVLWGDETGVFDVQPVEPAKLVLTLLTAHCLALRMGWRADHREQPGHGARWLRLIAPVLLFLALLGCALVQVDDYSPLILLLLWAGAMAFACAFAARRWLVAGMLGCVALAGIAGITALRAGDPGNVPASFYGDRFQVWLEPARHPHTGQQVQQ